MDLTKEVRKTGVNEEETFFKSYKVLYEKPSYRETLDCVDCTIYCLLAERYNFFYSLDHHENQVKTKNGELAIRFSESKIAEYLQVSRNKVSLAIRKLEILGLIKAERTPGQASNYIVKDIPAEVSQERITKVKELLAQRKQRNKKHNNKDMLKIEQDPKLASYRASNDDDLLHIEQVQPAQNRAGNDDDLLKMNTGTCSKLSNHLLKINQVPAQNEYNNKIKINKDLNKNSERGSASSLDDTACPPAISNTNDGIPGDVDASSKVGLSLPSDQNNAVSNNMMSPSGQNTIVVTPDGNTDQQDNDGIKQREQSPSSGHQQPGIGNESETAATTQKLPEEKTLKEWLAANCRIQWIIDDVLSKLDGNQIMPREHTPAWDAIMQQVAAALPPLKEVLLRLGKNQEDIDNVTRYIMKQPNPRPSKAITYLCCEHSWRLRVYYVVDECLSA